MPVDRALQIIKELLGQDTTLQDSTVLLVQNIIELLGFCLHNTYFSFQNKIYEQVESVDMGYLISALVANLYMENFEKKALNTTSTPPRVWMRYVDDTFVIQREDQKQNFLDHINNINLTIKFTVEGNQENGAIPFLDTLIKPEADNSLSITVYRKPTDTDQYLQWHCHHKLTVKYSVVSTLTHRAKVVCTGPELLIKELQHLRKALTKCKYPKWALDKLERKIFNSQEDSNLQGEIPEEDTSNPSGNTTGRDPNRRDSYLYNQT